MISTQISRKQISSKRWEKICGQGKKLLLKSSENDTTAKQGEVTSLEGVLAAAILFTLCYSFQLSWNWRLIEGWWVSGLKDTQSFQHFKQK